VSFVENEGPRLLPIDSNGIERLADVDAMPQLAPVLETVAKARSLLAAERSLIGFCGAPWTVATYMVAGQGTADQAPARLMAAARPDLFQRLIDLLVEVSAQYLIAQAEAGADVLQIFDSWAGSLDEEGFRRWSVTPTQAIVYRVKTARPDVKVIGFPRGAGLRLADYARDTGVDGLSLDWTVPLADAKTLQRRVTVQGNLDPMLLVAGGQALDAAIERILEALSPGSFIFNLGHGILPETPIAHVERLVARVRQGRD
jgi:uroporphyrinogen decarboxylase